MGFLWFKNNFNISLKMFCFYYISIAIQILILSTRRKENWSVFVIVLATEEYGMFQSRGFQITRQ